MSKHEKYRTSLTNTDWSKHELIVVKNDTVVIHHLKKPDTICQNVKFINCSGVLSVTGDYGNWIFCREFHPSEEGYVSAGYWCEKLRIHSTQQTSDYDPKGTIESLKEAIEKGAEDYGYTGDNLKAMKEYYSDCLRYADESKEIYQAHAYDNYPSCADHEAVICEFELKIQLKYVFDAFNEICRRLEKESLTQEVAEAAQ